MLELKIDTQALNALFPEGSEARLNLQQAVIQNFADRLIKGQGAEAVVKYLQTNLAPQVKFQIEKTMEEYMTKANWSRGATINADFAKMVSQEFRKQVDAIVSESRQAAVAMVNEKLTEALVNLPARIDEQVNNAVYQQGRKDAIAAIQAATTAAFKAE